MNQFPINDFVSLTASLTSFLPIIADQNAPKPAKAHVSIRLQNNQGYDFGELGPLNSSNVRKVFDNYRTTVEMNFYGPKAFNEALSFRNKLIFENTIDVLFAKDFSVITRGQVLNLTELLAKSQYEERALLELVIGWTSQETESVSNIERVNITGTLDHGVAPEENNLPPGEVVIDIALSQE